MNRAPDLDILAEAFVAEGCRIAAHYIAAKRQEAARPPAALPPPAVVQELVKAVVVQDEARPPSLKILLRAVSIVTGITVNELVSERRFAAAVRARMIYYTVARELTGRSLPAIGRSCGGRDHSTILHGIQKVQGNRAAFEPELSTVIDVLRMPE